MRRRYGPEFNGLRCDAPQSDLKVLLVGHGSDDPTTAAWQSALTSEGVPFDMVTDSDTPGGATVTLPTLSVGNFGQYNGVVMADSPAAYAAGVLAPLSAYESTFGVLQLDGYLYPSPALGVTDITSGGLDGTAAHLTTAGLALRLPRRCNIGNAAQAVAAAAAVGVSAAAGRDGDG